MDAPLLARPARHLVPDNVRPDAHRLIRDRLGCRSRRQGRRRVRLWRLRERRTAREQELLWRRELVRLNLPPHPKLFG